MRVQVTAEDISLFHLAARHYGDALYWWHIAQRNGMTDPDLTGLAVPATLDLPERVLPDAGGGLPPP